MINSPDQNSIPTYTLIVTLVALCFAWFTWMQSKRDKRKHLLKLLEKQLDCLGPWMSSENDGYGKELTEKEKFDNVRPYKLIYDTGYAPLIDSTILESIADVPEEIIGEIDQLYYDLVRIKNIQDFRNQIVSSDPILCRSISNKIEQYVAKKKETDFYKFRDSLKDDEQSIVNILLNYGTVLHCDVIGNKSHGARSHWEKIRSWVQKEKKSYSC